jgi:CheY-like chemotaxis protein
VGSGAEELTQARSPTVVLIAESDVALGELYRTALAHDGWSVEVVTRAADVITRVREAPPSVLLVSTLPDADQASVVEQVRSIPGTGSVIIVVLFDSLNRLDTRQLARLNVQAWLSKTRTTREKIADTIAGLVANAPHARE